MVAAGAAALCLQSAPPLPPATRNARTAAAVVTEVEWTSSCVAEEPKGGSAANLSDPFGVWAYAGTWPRKYALPPRGGCGYSTHSGADTEVASDALLAEIGARRRVVLSNDDCGYIALHSGTAENVGPAILDDDVADLRRELADFTEALKPVEKLFADADTFAGYVAGIRNRGWVDALTLHLAAALWGRRILVVQDGQHPVVCIAPPTQNGKRGAAEKKPWAHFSLINFSRLCVGAPLGSPFSTHFPS